ncbi:condensation domain-containing protein, partial [Pseudomonas aeruginosa]|uniref:condensation domain-containing protein n=1 Tax=Pseudomonas aeruginosa TaxID=287 RepID=UPI0027D3F5E9
YAQQRQWFLWQLEPDSAAYHIPAALRLCGELDVEALKRSFAALVERLAGFQQQRLVPVMALGDILLEETLLDRHQWHRAENRPLIDKLP